MQKIIPCLWFDKNAEEAVKFYTSVFKNSKVTRVTHYGDAGPMPKGTVLTIAFQLEGQDYLALNGGPEFKFNESISLSVSCQTQEEIDRLWKKLTEGGGQPGQCGWLKDKFGLSWQITPAVLDEWVSDDDPARADRVMQALLPMTKLDMRVLSQAANAATS
jgi:predicted 3-demethylubiquinone-9 3-methyltransferase (glyoxalase superfamily)